MAFSQVIYHYICKRTANEYCMFLYWYFCFPLVRAPSITHGDGAVLHCHWLLSDSPVSAFELSSHFQKSLCPLWYISASHLSCCCTKIKHLNLQKITIFLDSSYCCHESGSPSLQPHSCHEMLHFFKHKQQCQDVSTHSQYAHILLPELTPDTHCQVCYLLLVQLEPDDTKTLKGRKTWIVWRKLT